MDIYLWDYENPVVKNMCAKYQNKSLFAEVMKMLWRQ